MNRIQRKNGTEVRDKYNIPENPDYTAAASAADCTGLIPAGTVGEELMDLYQEVYPFGAQKITETDFR